MPEDTFRFTPEQLNRLEQELWQLIDSHSITEDHQLPPVEALLGPDDACDLFAEALNLYATAIIEHKESTWKNHPITEHLAICTHCLEKLNRILASHEEAVIPRRRLGADVDITIFDKHLTDEGEVLRSAVDPRRPKLLDSGFMQHPSDWHFSLESLPKPDDLRPRIRLTLAAPDGNPANVPVTLVLLGQVLQGVTDENGAIDLCPDVIPTAGAPQIPVLNVNVHLSELEIA